MSRKSLAPIVTLLLIALLVAGPVGCGGGGGAAMTLTVNSLADTLTPPAGTVTLRRALAEVPDGGRIVFDSALSGQTINLTQIGERHSTLRGEAYAGMSFAGYLERDYGASALYVNKDVTIDASGLAEPVTLNWAGGDDDPARVLAVYGDLVMHNVRLTGGFSEAAELETDQLYTLARGGGLATWGRAYLKDCEIYSNRCEGDSVPARDRGAMGGGIYANLIYMDDCVISGNRVKGYGAAGGGVYTVGGEGWDGLGSVFERCSISGNRVTGQSTYGGGVFTEGGGRGGDEWLEMTNCTIAWNVIEDNPDIGETGGPPPPQYYYRGGGVYMTNGSLRITSCTIVENEVTGIEAEFKGKPNMSGGGIACTIGDAHVVEYMELGQSIVAGNTVMGEVDDLYTGSLLQFFSHGYNLVGELDFSEILVPIPAWWSLSRKHWPQEGDIDGVDPADALAAANPILHPSILSAGVEEGARVAASFTPGTLAVERVPASGWDIDYIRAQYSVLDGHDDDFLAIVLEILRDDWGMGAAFGQDLVYEGVDWFEEADTWPSSPENEEWIAFWRGLDEAIGDQMGCEKLGDLFWGGFQSGALGENIVIEVNEEHADETLSGSDQYGKARPQGAMGDIGAVEHNSTPL